MGEQMIPIGKVIVQTYIVKATTGTAPAGSVVGDFVKNGGTSTYTVGGVSLPVGSYGRIKSVSPFQLDVATVGSDRGLPGKDGESGAAGVNGVPFWQGECKIENGMNTVPFAIQEVNGFELLTLAIYEPDTHGLGFHAHVGHGAWEKTGYFTKIRLDRGSESWSLNQVAEVYLEMEGNQLYVEGLPETTTAPNNYNPLGWYIIAAYRNYYEGGF